MNSRSIVNIFLLTALVSFASFYYYKTNQTIITQHLTSLKLNEINKIHIKKANGNNILFIKNSANLWKMQRPYSINAHQFRIKTLLKLSQIAVENSFDIDNLKLQDYGLNKPEVSIIFNQTKVDLGKINPLNNHRYVQAENKIALIDDTNYPLLNAQAAGFINLSIITEDFDLIKLEVSYTGQIIKSSTSNEALQLWRNAKAFSVHRYLPRKNLGTVTLYSKNKQITFKITDSDPWLILARPELEIEFHLDKSNNKNLLMLNDA